MASTRDNEHLAGDHMRYVFVPVVLCPACSSTEWKVYGHARNVEVKTQYARCIDCSHKFFIVHIDSFNSVENEVGPNATLARHGDQVRQADRRRDR